ncbi:MAG: hypothetical protein ACQESR_07870 [Planctomycetota bacterium]
MRATDVFHLPFADRAVPRARLGSTKTSRQKLMPWNHRCAAASARWPTRLAAPSARRQRVFNWCDTAMHAARFTPCVSRIAVVSAEASLSGPSNPSPERRRGTSPAIDAGTVMPNINEDYTGKAPDLGPLLTWDRWSSASPCRITAHGRKH